MATGNRKKKLEQMSFPNIKNRYFLRLSMIIGIDFCLKMEYRLKTGTFQRDCEFPASFHHSFAPEIEQKQLNNMSPFAIFAIVLTIAYIIYLWREYQSRPVR